MKPSSFFKQQFLFLKALFSIRRAFLSMVFSTLFFSLAILMKEELLTPPITWLLWTGGSIQAIFACRYSATPVLILLALAIAGGSSLFWVLGTLGALFTATFRLKEIVQQTKNE